MVFMKETKAVKKMNVKPYLLPVYIILSLLFIVWSAYSYIGNFVAGQAFQNGVQNGQAAAENNIVAQIEKLSQDCTQPVKVGQVELINVACLQQAAPAGEIMEKEEAAQ